MECLVKIFKVPNYFVALTSPQQNLQCMIKRLNLEHILFLDIETVPQHSRFDELDDASKILWEQKSQYQRKDEISAAEFYERAGIWAEFGKIVCISVGYFVLKGDIRNFRVTSFHGDEVKILNDFKSLLE